MVGKEQLLVIFNHNREK